MTGALNADQHEPDIVAMDCAKSVIVKSDEEPRDRKTKAKCVSIFSLTTSSMSDVDIARCGNPYQTSVRGNVVETDLRASAENAKTHTTEVNELGLIGDKEQRKRREEMNENKVSFQSKTDALRVV